MHRRQTAVPIFLFLLFVSFLLYLLRFTVVGKMSMTYISAITNPFRYAVVATYASGKGQPTAMQKLQDENAALRARLTQVKIQEKEVQALRDQFLTTFPHASTLLPVKIIGYKAFIPGISIPEQIVIDGGTNDGLRKNDAIVYKNNLIGKISIAHEHVSLVDLVYLKGFSVTSTAAGTGALGISKGQGQGNIIIDNVVLPDILNKDDLVVTKGSTDSDESGIPPNLVIGKIKSVNRKASNLFQSATVVSQVDITRVGLVFVIRKSR